MDKGFVIVVGSLNELLRAEFVAHSIRVTQSRHHHLTVIVPMTVKVPNSVKNVFHRVISYDGTASNTATARKLVGYLNTPYTHTILIDTPVLFSVSIDYWWKLLEGNDFVIPGQIQSWRGGVLHKNLGGLYGVRDLTPVYASMIYFEKSDQSLAIFEMMSLIEADWDDYQAVTFDQSVTSGGTDIIASCALSALGYANDTVINNDWFSIVHMGAEFYDSGADNTWDTQLQSHITDQGLIIIGQHIQTHPIMISDSTFFSSQKLSTYRRCLL